MNVLRWIHALRGMLLAPAMKHRFIQTRYRVGIPTLRLLP